VIVDKQDTCYPAVLRASNLSGPYSQSLSNLKDFQTDNTEAYILIDSPRDTVRVSKTAGTKLKFDIYTGNLVSWTASANQSWLTVNEDVANSKLSVEISEENTGNIRIAQVILEGGNAKDTLWIVQDSGMVSIHENVVINNIQIFPNPNTGRFTLNVDKKEKVQLSVLIYDTKGKIVYNKNINKNQQSFSEQIDLTQYDKGLYIVNIRSEGRNWVRKLVVY
jgi:hypothetical protein